MRNNVINLGFEKVLVDRLSLFERVWNPSLQNECFQPEVHVEENKNGYLLSLDLPGVKKEDIRINVTENILRLTGECKRERLFKRFERGFALPSSVESANIQADMEDGVLRVALPKKESAKPRTIEIEKGKMELFSKMTESVKEECLSK